MLTRFRYYPIAKKKINEDSINKKRNGNKLLNKEKLIEPQSQNVNVYSNV